MPSNDDFTWADRFMDIQFEAYEAYGVSSAPIGDTYKEMVSWCENRISELGYDGFITDVIINIVTNENAHMVAEAMQNIIDQ